VKKVKAKTKRPAGSWVEVKEIHPGKFYEYLRWRENGRLRSKYLGRALRSTRARA